MIPCPSCATPVSVKASAWARCSGCRAMVFPAGSGPIVVVAHESERVAARIGVVLSDIGVSPVHAPRGDAVLDLVGAVRSSAVVLDVGLAEVMAFQIVERIRARPGLAGVKVVLVASVYNKTAYKRRPKSLYGADDYVEQHHIHDLLPEKLCRLLGLTAPVKPEPEQRVSGQDTREDLRNGERLRALARSIAADVVLYHPDEVMAAARFHPPPALLRALDEGRRLLAEMVAPAELGNDDPVLEAFAAILAGLDGGDA